MQKIVLIDVGSPRSELNEPLGIENLTGKLESEFQKNVEIKQFFLQLEDGDIYKFLNEYSPNVVGISTKIGSYEISISIIDHCLRMKNQPIVVVGDILSTILYEQLLLRYNNIICVLGEGEDAIIGIVSQLDNGIDDINEKVYHKDVPNLALFLNNSIVKTTQKPVDLTIDFYPRRQFITALLDKYGIVRAEASRGCPWNNCSFCYLKTKYNGQKWRPFNSNKVIEELIQLCLHKVQMVYYNDEDFIGNDPERAESIADLILINKEKGLIHKDLIFFISTSVRSVLKSFDDKSRVIGMLKKMVDAGFKEIFLGIESGSSSQINRYNKGVTIEENRIAISILLNLKADIDIGFIMFDHQMSVQDLKDNLNFIP